MVQRLLIFAVLLTTCLSAWGQVPSLIARPPVVPWSAEYRAQQVKELRLEGRLPGWANYVCGQDQIGISAGIFMLIAYQQSGFSREDGYTRGLTYQEYFGMDEKIPSPLAINMPESPEDVALEKAQSERDISEHKPNATVSTQFMIRAHISIITAKNQIADTKKALARGFISDVDMKDEMIRALLDGPEGTNWHNYVDKHPDVWEFWLAQQKYENTGNPLPEDVKVYREGNVIYETGWTGSGTFETTAGMDKAEAKDVPLNVRIQMTPTPSGLRYTQGGNIGMTVNGACDPIAQSK